MSRPQGGLAPAAADGKRQRSRMLAVITEACTGCAACVDFCPVDCIDGSPDSSQASATHQAVQVHEDECIGCEVCAKVCEELTWNAIEMVPFDEGKGATGRYAAPTALS